jgi:hypothetical protein
MLELLKVCAEALQKAIPSILKARRAEKAADLGAELFLVYTHLNEALICGADIVSSLEIYVQRMAEPAKPGRQKYALTGGHWIAYKVEAQQHNLAKVGRDMLRWRRQLQVIDPTAFESLVPLIEGKFNALDALLRLMTHGETLPVVPAGGLALLMAGPPEPVGQRSGPNQLVKQIAESAIPTNVSWDETILRQVKTHLSEDNPNEQLDQLRRSLGQLRESLLKVFSLEDIVLKVGDRRFEERYNGDHFW